MKTLADRYNNKRPKVNSHLVAILHMNSLRSESVSELQFCVSFEENVMAIGALKVNTEASGIIWVRLFSGKFD